MPFVSTRTWQFTYFAMQLGERSWQGKDVLDFGGNIGNILKDPNSTIDHDRYWCIDVDREAIEKGKKLYPEAHWVPYDRFCFFFNPYGAPHLKLPQLEQQFDIVLAYSVFTNTSTADMIELVDELQGCLKKDGALAFTFIDPHFRSWPDTYEGDNLLWRLEKIRVEENPDIDVGETAERARGSSCCTVVNGRDLYVDTDEISPCEPEQQRSRYVFHTEEYMRQLFPRATILPPVNDEMQHCCIIRPA